MGRALVQPRIVDILVKRSICESPAELHEYITHQSASFDRILSKTPEMDFPGWIAYKLRCTGKDARALINWSKSQTLRQNAGLQ